MREQRPGQLGRLIRTVQMSHLMAESRVDPRVVIKPPVCSQLFVTCRLFVDTSRQPPVISERAADLLRVALRFFPRVKQAFMTCGSAFKFLFASQNVDTYRGFSGTTP